MSKDDPKGDVWFWSDQHFNHENVWKKFLQPDGVTPLRPFTSTEEMNETMIANCNKVVKPQDKLYFLGDVTMSRKNLSWVDRCNGHKRLIFGNHDLGESALYLEHFESVMSMRIFSDIICTHIPIHTGSIARFGTNVHGHLHSNVVNDPRYMSVCVEHTNYTPIHLDELRARIKQNQEKFKYTKSVIHWQTGKLWTDLVPSGDIDYMASSGPG